MANLMQNRQYISRHLDIYTSLLLIFVDASLIQADENLLTISKMTLN